MGKSVLIVDDDTEVAAVVGSELEAMGYQIRYVERGRQAIEHIEKYHPRLVLLDICLPDINGLEILEEIKKRFTDVYVLMISGQADIPMAVDCMKLGAFDFIEKPINLSELLTRVKNVFKQCHLEDEVTSLKRELGEKYKFKSIVGSSAKMKKVFELMEMASKSPINVLITGESGTGKELIARAIHFNSFQKDGPFMAVDCGAIPHHLLESELYGHEKGSFTGATMSKAGKFQQAQDGTLFLDEIGEMPLEQQVKLLRAIQEREIQRVGSNQTISINARFICATNQNLEDLVKAKKFREDLYFRICVLPIPLPSLRERREDIPLLLNYFIKRHAGESSQAKVSKEALDKLVLYEWPGNIRELENFIERTLLMKGENTLITEQEVDAMELFSKKPASLEHAQTIDDAEKCLIERTLLQSNGNVSQASKILNISRDTFYRKMKKYAIQNGGSGD